MRDRARTISERAGHLTIAHGALTSRRTVDEITTIVGDVEILRRQIERLGGEGHDRTVAAELRVARRDLDTALLHVLDLLSRSQTDPPG